MHRLVELLGAPAANLRLPVQSQGLRSRVLQFFFFGFKVWGRWKQVSIRGDGLVVVWSGIQAGVLDARQCFFFVCATPWH